MSSSAQRPKWRRIYLQTIALLHKNFLIFYKSPISLICRALLFPIAVAVIFSVLRNLSLTSFSDDSSDNGISTTSYPVSNLDGAMEKINLWKLVFVRNGFSNESISPIVDGIHSQLTSPNLELYSVDDPNDLFDLCKQSTQGASDCYAAVIFTSFNSTNVEYYIALNGDDGDGWESGEGFFRTDDSLLASRILPLQWTIDSLIGNFSNIAKPSLQPFTGYFGPGAETNDPDAPATNGPYWLSLIAVFIGPIFILILIGVVYHLAVFVATERETSISELMAAQNVTATPRILSNLISFYAVYFPGVLASSIILTQVLFLKTSDILFLFVTLLALGSITTSSHFLASFFGRAQLAGLSSSTLVFALALVSLAGLLSSLDTTSQVTALSLIFPPICWANFIADVALREYNLKRFTLHPGPTFLSPEPYSPKIQLMDGYLYVIFFIVQIFVYGAGAYAIERMLWGVKRDFQKIDASSDVALRCTGLSKTYYGKRPWYWPFTRKGKTVQAVNNLDLEVKKGSVTFLLGPNGGGKTTTLKCVAGMTSMDPGSRLELNESGQVFGICPQSNVFWESLTVQEHIKIWRRLKTAAFDDQLKDDDDILAECDLVDKGQARAKTLSGGQMRKLQLAIAFVGGSKVCCIDEASSGLDPLSRRNIWDIIQKGHSRRTCLITTHFLDEADVLADHIAIVYKGKLVCKGPGTSLKARFGDDYIIRSESDEDGNNMVWRTSNSAEATSKILELEALSEDSTYNVVFPTLEQVFLKVTSDTAIHDNGGDGIVGDEETPTAIDEKIFALENEIAEDIDLDVGHTIGITRQIAALFHKRYILLGQKGWISYGINLLIPIVIACALVKFMYRFPSLQTCATNEVILRNGTAGQTVDAYDNPVFAPLESEYPPSIYLYGKAPPAFLGPVSEFSGEVQDALFDSNIVPLITTESYYTTVTNVSKAPAFVSSIDDMVATITNYSGYFDGFGLFAPTPETAILFYDTSTYEAALNMAAFSFLTNRIANSTGSSRLVSAQLRTMSHAQNNVDFRALPIAVLLALAFIASASIAVIYPSFEKNNRVRALQYCNGVSPFALWFGYLLFDLQFILVQAIFVWGLLFAGPLSKLWYESSYILGVFILFGIATYLGVYLLSLFTKKAAFAIAAGIHVLLCILYVVAYVMNQSFGDMNNLHQTYSYLQYGLGLSSPAANLVRALFLAGNSFEILCGKYGDADTSNPFAYVRYGSVYANLLIQIIFLICVLTIYEYGSADWWRRNVTHRGVPARLHYIVEGDPAESTAQTEKTARPAAVVATDEILNVSRISKHFGPLFAVENVSFNINANQTLALLGGNGAGKTTVINMIRGELKPDFGTIHLDGISVLAQPHKARQHIGVCPQDDAVDNLTVEQTLTFYATVKGLSNIAANVTKVLTALNITSFSSVSVKALSGGTRRKLSVAIALLGNPRILLLDEPSTGQDAGAKRILWKALQAISANRAILLTTHSMEEAEALATNVAIMGTRMLAKGTLGELQGRFGGMFCVRAVRVGSEEEEVVERVVREVFEDRVSNYQDSHGQVSFNLPHERRELGAIMRAMEGLKGEVVEGDDNNAEGGGVGGSSAAVTKESKRFITDYTVTGPTLEEVFMNVAREAGIAGAGNV